MPTLLKADLKKLWPGPIRKIDVGNQTLLPPSPPAQRIASGGAEGAIPFTIKKFGPYSKSYFKCYFQLDGAGKFKMPPGPATNAFSAAFEHSPTRNDKGAFDRALVGKIEREIVSGLTFEGNVVFTDEEYQLIARGEWMAALKKMFAARFKTSGNLFWNVNGELEGSIAPDDEFCFFGITGKLAIPVKINDIAGLFGRTTDLPVIPSNTELEAEVSLMVRFGPSEQGWIAIGQRIGGAALKAAVEKIPVEAAKTAMRGAISSTGAFAAGAAAGVGLMYLNCVLLAAYTASGRRLGVLTHYTSGYVTRVFEERSGETSSWATFRKMNESRYPIYVGGYKDADIAVNKFGVDTIERILIRSFGMDSSWWPFRDPRSMVGVHINLEEEVHVLATHMANGMNDNLDELASYVGMCNTGWTFY